MGWRKQRRLLAIERLTSRVDLWENTLVGEPTEGGKTMNATPIAWQYEASVHCVKCAEGKWGAALNDEGTLDSEGNNLHPVFDWDEVNLCGESCGTCLDWAIEPVPHEPASCLLGYDCRLPQAAAL